MQRPSWMSWTVVLGIALVALSSALYFTHYLIFHDAHHIFIYLLGDIAFVPIEVLMVTLIIHRLLVSHEKRAMMNKLNMVIGAFFSEVGSEAIRRMLTFAGSGVGEDTTMALSPKWKTADFARARRMLTTHDWHLDASRGDLRGLKDFFASRREFLVGLLRNPNLLEHDAFTDMLWAVFHLAEELDHRDDPSILPGSDLQHLSGDMKRAFEALTVQWLAYMAHLQSRYPYLFSLAARTNPFDAHPPVMVT